MRKLLLLRRGAEIDDKYTKSVHKLYKLVVETYIFCERAEYNSGYFSPNGNQASQQMAFYVCGFVFFLSMHHHMYHIHRWLHLCTFYLVSVDRLIVQLLLLLFYFAFISHFRQMRFHFNFYQLKTVLFHHIYHTIFSAETSVETSMKTLKRRIRHIMRHTRCTKS